MTDTASKQASKQTAEQASEGSSGKRLVIAILLFAIPIGSAGLLARAALRQKRGRLTADKVLESIRKDGLLEGVEARDRGSQKSQAAVQAMISQVNSDERFLAALKTLGSFQPRRLSERVTWRRQLIELLAKRPAQLSAQAKLSDALKRLEGESFTQVLSAELLSLWRDLDSVQQQFASEHSSVKTLFFKAQAEDMRSSITRVFGTALQASRLKQSQKAADKAGAVLDKAVKIVIQEQQRVSYEQLKLLPDLKHCFEMEARGRCALKLLAFANEIKAQSPKTAPSQWASLPEDPMRVGETLNYERLSENRARVWSRFDSKALSLTLEWR